MRLREELSDQLRALDDLKTMAASYGCDIGRPAANAREAVQWTYFGYLGAIIPISAAGILTFGIAGEVRWLDAAALALGAVVGARLGAGLLARVEERTLKIAFGCFLVAAAIAMAVHV